jgi:hypothetical protein
VLTAMAGGNGLSLGTTELIVARLEPFLWISTLLAVVWLLPNTQEFMGRVRPALGFRYIADRSRLFWRLQWRPVRAWAAACALALVVSLSRLSQISEFIYYNF